MGWLLEKPNERKLKKKIIDFITYFDPPHWAVFLFGLFLGGILFCIVFLKLIKIL
jgi:hypothetical protein